jgi:hypothetical protein
MGLREILSQHHADQIPTDYSGCTTEAEIRQRAMELVSQRQSMRDVSGKKLAYPSYQILETSKKW